MQFITSLAIISGQGSACVIHLGNWIRNKSSFPVNSAVSQVLTSSMLDKSKLHNAIAPCVGFFTFFGFADLVIQRNINTRKKCAALWILGKYLLILAVMTFLFCDSMMGRIGALRDQNGITLHLLMYIGTAGEGFTAVIQSLTSSSASLMFMRKMTQVDEILTKSLSLKIDYEDLRWKLLTNILSALFVDFACSFAVILLVLSYNVKLWLILSYFFVPILLCRIFLQRFIFYVQLVTSYLEAMITVVEKAIATQPLLVRKDERKYWSLNSKRHHVRVKALRKAYKLLWEASVLVNRSYRVELVFGTIMKFVSLLYQGYSLCVDIALKNVNNRQYIWLVISGSVLFLMHHSCQLCKKKVTFVEK